MRARMRAEGETQKSKNVPLLEGGDFESRHSLTIANIQGGES